MVHDVCATLFCYYPSRRLLVVVELVFGKAGLSSNDSVVINGLIFLIMVNANRLTCLCFQLSL
jgi:hypothetical protein